MYVPNFFIVMYVPNFFIVMYVYNFFIVMYVLFSVFCVLFVCKCVLYCCHWVSTHLQLNQYNETNIMQFSINLLRIKGPLHVLSITCSSSGSNTQMAFGILVEDPWFSINWMKSASRWFHYTDILRCTVSTTLRLQLNIFNITSYNIAQSVCKDRLGAF
jgi:hypothetical protein